MSRKPTGRRRFRIEKRMFRKPKLILQIEFHYNGYECVGPFVDPVQYRQWHDARPEDITIEETTQ